MHGRSRRIDTDRRRPLCRRPPATASPKICRDPSPTQARRHRDLVEPRASILTGGRRQLLQATRRRQRHGERSDDLLAPHDHPALTRKRPCESRLRRLIDRGEVQSPRAQFRIGLVQEFRERDGIRGLEPSDSEIRVGVPAHGSSRQASTRESDPTPSAAWFVAMMNRMSLSSRRSLVPASRTADQRTTVDADVSGAAPPTRASETTATSAIALARLVFPNTSASEATRLRQAGE